MRFIVTKDTGETKDTGKAAFESFVAFVTLVFIGRSAVSV